MSLANLATTIKISKEDDPKAPLGSLILGSSLLASALGEDFPGAKQMLDAINSYGAFSGTVEILGRKVEIKGGVGDIDGHKIFINQKGQMADETGKIMGRIDNGKFVVIDKQQAEQMANDGTAVQKGGVQ